MVVRVKREKEPQLEYYGAVSGELLGSSAGVRTSVTITPTDDYLILVPKNSVGNVQVELGSFATSYIPTTTAEATRAADIASIDTADFGYNADAGTVVMEFNTTAAAGTSNAQFVFSSGSVCRVLYSNAGSGGNWYSWDGTTSLNYTSVDPIVFGSQPIKTAYAEDNNGGITYHSGLSGASSSASSLFDNLQANNKFDIGNRTGTAYFLNGHIKSIKYYPRRLSNQQLQDLTS